MHNTRLASLLHNYAKKLVLCCSMYSTCARSHHTVYMAAITCTCTGLYVGLCMTEGGYISSGNMPKCSVHDNPNKNLFLIIHQMHIYCIFEPKSSVELSNQIENFKHASSQGNLLKPLARYRMPMGGDVPRSYVKIAYELTLLTKRRVHANSLVYDPDVLYVYIYFECEF